MLLGDGRFAKDSRFRYHASNTVLRKQALQKGRVFIQKNSQLENLTAEELKQKLIDNPSLYQKVICYNSTLRSTPSYWYQKTKQLEDMVSQLKHPTFFFTISAADIQWPALYR